MDIKEIREKIDHKVKNMGETPFIKISTVDEPEIFQKVSENAPSSKFVYERERSMECKNKRQIEVECKSKAWYGSSPYHPISKLNEYTILLNMKRITNNLLSYLPRIEYILPNSIKIYHGLMNYKIMSNGESDEPNTYQSECFVVIDSDAKVFQVIPITVASQKMLMCENFNAFQVYYFEMLTLLNQEGKVSLKVYPPRDENVPPKRAKPNSDLERVHLLKSQESNFISQIPTPIILQKYISHVETNLADSFTLEGNRYVYPTGIMLLSEMKLTKFLNDKLPWLQMYEGLYANDFDVKEFEKTGIMKIPYLANYDFGIYGKYEIPRFLYKFDLSEETVKAKSETAILNDVYEYIQLTKSIFESIVYIYADLMPTDIKVNAPEEPKAMLNVMPNVITYD